VDTVLAEIKIGDNLTESQRDRLVAVLRAHTDCFALSMSEVTVVPGAEHKLNIPNRKNAKFRTNPRQRPLSTPQKVYLDSMLDKMLDAEIIGPIDHREVKCCRATTLAKKAHIGEGLTIGELQHRVNDECITHGFPTAFENLPPRETPESKPTATEEDTKWRVCQEFNDLNKVTEVPPMPQGDIRLKQQRLSGHRWLNMFDFASGFYACAITECDQPYICFYVEGRGYFKYLQMPFGLGTFDVRKHDCQCAG
jgi:hypothetical protein